MVEISPFHLFIFHLRYSIELHQRVSFQIHHLAVNALLKSNQVNELEGGALLGFDQDSGSGINASDKNYGFDDTTTCAPAFRVLKQLIQRCLADAVTSGNVYADALLQHLYRWLCRFRMAVFSVSRLSLDIPFL